MCVCVCVCVCARACEIVCKLCFYPRVMRLRLTALISYRCGYALVRFPMRKEIFSVKRIYSNLSIVNNLRSYRYATVIPFYKADNCCRTRRSDHSSHLKLSERSFTSVRTSGRNPAVH